jgi:hypothetical protein
MGRRYLELPAEVGEVRSEIEGWRQNRQKRSPMPARLWSAAAALAKVHGIYRISQALRLILICYQVDTNYPRPCRQAA